MKYYVTLGGNEFVVDVNDAHGTLTLTQDGKTFTVDVSAIQHGEQYSVLVDQRSFAVSLDGDGKKLALILDGHSYAVEVEDDRERASRALSHAHAPTGGLVESVMPGIVRKVEVKIGDAVKRGDRLLVLEAMKMENEIFAGVDGKITTVHVEAQQEVRQGDLLVTITVG